MKRKTAAVTMEGPEGVSKWKEAESPRATESTPIIAAAAAICSGVRQRRLAAAAGIISRDVMSRIPTTFIASAITAAMTNISVS